MIAEDIKALLNKNQTNIVQITPELLKSVDEVILSDNPDEEAISIYRKFSPENVNLDNSNSELLSLLKNFAKEKIITHKYSSALLIYRLLVLKTDGNSEVFYDISQIMAELDKNEDAVKFIKLYEKNEGNLPLKLLTLANFYNLQLKDYKTAIKYYEQYLKIDETKAVIYTILASLYAKAYGDLSLKDQLFYFQKAYRLKPEDRLVLHGLVFCYEKLGDKVSADKLYKELLENNPTENDFFNYGGFLINCGDFENGHEYFTHRFNIDDINLKYPINGDDKKRWDFERDITDKTLLIHYEQGFGDTFMYCRFVPLMKKFTKKIIFVVQDEMIELIKSSKMISKDIKIISDKIDLSTVKYDYHMALLDTPYVLKINTEQIPFKEGYLTVAKTKISQYAKKYVKATSNFKVGIAYHGNKNANYHGRDIDFSRFKSLFKINNIDFYSFSTEKEDDGRVTYLNDSFKDFTQTACAIKNMDLIVTTDNVILNLAGALGVETIGLFNKYPNYRWYKLSGDDVGWYKSVKPMQAEDENCWSELFEYLYQILENKVRLN